MVAKKTADITRIAAHAAAKSRLPHHVGRDQGVVARAAARPKTKPTISRRRRHEQPDDPRVIPAQSVDLVEGDQQGDQADGHGDDPR